MLLEYGKDNLVHISTIKRGILQISKLCSVNQTKQQLFILLVRYGTALMNPFEIAIYSTTFIESKCSIVSLYVT